MKSRMVALSILSFVLGAGLFSYNPTNADLIQARGAGVHDVAATAPHWPGSVDFGVPAPDDRSADREALKAHIEKIFQAFVDCDCATIRATHAPNWIGFTRGATSILRGLDQYLNSSARFCVDKTAACGIANYKITDIDYMFYGDAALVFYVAEVGLGKQKPVQVKFRSLDVYEKSHDHWMQVASHIDTSPDSVQQQFQRSMEYRQPRPEELKQILAAREAVWRAYFSNDRAQLDKFIPPETIAINPSQEPWSHRPEILKGASDFAQAGGKLLNLEFPQTEVQLYGNVVVLYSTYHTELEVNGQRMQQSGRATEIFVSRDGTLVNSGWHLDAAR